MDSNHDPGSCDRIEGASGKGASGEWSDNGGGRFPEVSEEEGKELIPFYPCEHCATKEKGMR